MSRAPVSEISVHGNDPLVKVASSATSDGKDVEVVDAVQDVVGGLPSDGYVARKEPIVTRRVCLSFGRLLYRVCNNI